MILGRIDPSLFWESCDLHFLWSFFACFGCCWESLATCIFCRRRVVGNGSNKDLSQRLIAAFITLEQYIGVSQANVHNHIFTSSIEFLFLLFLLSYKIVRNFQLSHWISILILIWNGRNIPNSDGWSGESDIFTLNVTFLPNIQIRLQGSLSEEGQLRDFNFSRLIASAVSLRLKSSRAAVSAESWFCGGVDGKSGIGESQDCVHDLFWSKAGLRREQQLHIWNS